MDTPAEFAATYQHMSDGQLLQTANEGGLADEARQALHEELHRRNLKLADLPKYKESRRTRLKRNSAEREFPLSRYGGTGYFFFGRHYLTQADREANIQLRTKWFSISYLPIVPLASFRFRCKQRGWRFFGWTDQVVVSKVPLDWNQVFLTWLKASPVYLAILAMAVLWITHRSR